MQAIRAGALRHGLYSRGRLLMQVPHNVKRCRRWQTAIPGILSTGRLLAARGGSDPHSVTQVRCCSSGMWCHARRCHALSCLTTLCHVLPRLTMICHALSCLAALCHAMPYYAISCFAMPYHALPCHAMPCLAMLCHPLPHLAMPCLAMPYHALPCHAMPCSSSLAPGLLPPCTAATSARTQSGSRHNLPHLRPNGSEK